MLVTENFENNISEGVSIFESNTCFLKKTLKTQGSHRGGARAPVGLSTVTVRRVRKWYGCREGAGQHDF